MTCELNKWHAIVAAKTLIYQSITSYYDADGDHAGVDNLHALHGAASLPQ